MTSAILKRFSQMWKRRLSPKVPTATGQPLGLEASQVDSLRQLVSSPSYSSGLLPLLERIHEQQAEVLLQGLDHEKYLFQCGVVYAIRRLYQLPNEILTKVTELEARQDARVSADRSRDGRSIFLNSPWWESYIADSASRKPDTL